MSPATVARTRRRAGRQTWTAKTTRCGRSRSHASTHAGSGVPEPASHPRAGAEWTSSAASSECVIVMIVTVVGIAAGRQVI
ncbi:MAG: hypothetical protein HOV94_44425 [Saccharothrix sp.]|nr:hypothetical protein [Saccharothrix sp.]